MCEGVNVKRCNYLYIKYYILYMKEIYLIRHGETEWNSLGLGMGSRNDIKLNKVGMK